MKKNGEDITMGFLKRLLGIGVTAGATVAAVKVAEQVKENNPNGIPDVNGDGKVDAKDYFEEVKKATVEVYQEATAAIKQKAPEFSQKAKDVADDVKEAVTNATETVKEKAPEYAEKAKDAVISAKDAIVNAFDKKDDGAPQA
jgi:histone H3/H4